MAKSLLGIRHSYFMWRAHEQVIRCVSDNRTILLVQSFESEMPSSTSPSRNGQQNRIPGSWAASQSKDIEDIRDDSIFRPWELRQGVEIDVIYHSEKGIKQALHFNQHQEYLSGEFSSQVQHPQPRIVRKSSCELFIQGLDPEKTNESQNQ